MDAHEAIDAIARDPRPTRTGELAAFVDDARAIMKTALRSLEAIERPLRCVECAAESTGSARGWRAFLTVDDVVAFYCPSCTTREFDDDE
jgi:hypothetical protein